MAGQREQHVLKAVLKRATTDRTFRRQLLTDPRTAIERAFGIRIPPEYRLRFIERDPDVDALVVLPDFQSESGPDAEGELSDDDLEDVAGGMEPEFMDAEMTWSDEEL